MTLLRSPLGAVVLLAAGCSDASHVGNDAVHPGGQRDSGARPAMGSDAGSTPLDPHVVRVELTSDKSALCLGECTALHARAEGGQAPYAYAWSDGALAGDTVRVCPPHDTSYQLSVHDTATLGGEFPVPEQTAEASITLTVRDCTLPDPPVYRPPVEVCRMELTTSPGTSARPEAVRVGIGGATASDPQGGVLVAGTFLGILRLAPSSPPSPLAEPFRVYLAKYGADCRLQWSQLQGDDSVEVDLLDVASDALGNFAVITGWRHLRRWWEPEPDPSFFVVSKLRNDGSTIYSRRFDGDGTLSSLRMNGRGELLFVAQSANISGLGVPRSGAADSWVTVVKLDPGGETVFAHALAPATVGGAAALDESGAVYVGGVRDWVNPADTSGTRATMFVSSLGQDGIPRWEVTRPHRTIATFNFRNANLALDSRGGLMLAVMEFPEAPEPALTTSWRLSPDASPLSLITPTIEPNGTVDAVEGVLLIGEQLWLANVAGDNLGRQRVTAYASDGSTSWSYTRTGEVGETFMDISASEEQLMLTTYIDRPQPEQDGRLIVSRLVYGPP